MDIESVLTASLLVGGSEALDRIAGGLISLHDGWTRAGVDPSALAWLRKLIADAAWWRGRLIAGASASASSASWPQASS